MTRSLRVLSIALTAMLVQTLGATPAYAVDSIIKSAVVPYGNPGLIDVSVDSVRFPEREVAIGGLVSCAGWNTLVYVVDFSVTQSREGRTITATGYDDQIRCGAPFSAVVSSTPGQALWVGPAWIEVTASACVGLTTFSCAVETLRLRVVLLPA